MRTKSILLLSTVLLSTACSTGKHVPTEEETRLGKIEKIHEWNVARMLREVEDAKRQERFDALFQEHCARAEL